MSTVVSPGSNLPLPVGISQGQQFLQNHLIRFKSGEGDQPNGLGGPINFAHEIPNRSPRNVFDDISDQYQEFGLRRYRCYYLFNSHYTLAIPNIVAYVKQPSQNSKSRIAFAFGTSGFNGTEQTIQSQFHDPVGVKWNGAQARIEASFLREPLKPRNWVAVWIREILDFNAQNTEFNYYAIRIETSDPVAVLGQPDFNICYVGNMGCDANTFGKVWGKIKGRNPTSIFTLGNNSYQPTGDCWLNTISSLRDRVKMCFGAWDWYQPFYADKLDDASFPRVPDDWYWPVPDQPCQSPTGRYSHEELFEIKKIEPEPLDDPHQGLQPPPHWDIYVWDEGDEPGQKGENIEETFGPFMTEANAEAYATWLRTCEIITSEISLEKFNVTLQNRYRAYFGITNFDGYQSFYANNIHFLILNTNSISLGHTEESPQYRFAEEQLKRALDNAFVDWRIVIGYRPGNVASNDSMRTVINPDGTVGLQSTGYQGPIRQFNELYKPLFEKYNVTLYINGNVNNYQRSGILKFDSGNWIEPTEQAPTTGPEYKVKGRALDGSGIIYLTVGAGGARLQANEGLPSWIKKSFSNTYGYMNMTSLKNGQFLQFRYYDINDNLLDYFSVGREAFEFTPTPPAGNIPPATTTPFGIRQIYPSKPGGDFWYSTTWGNGNARIVPIDCGTDPAAPELHHRSNSGSVCSIDGEGVMRLSTGGRVGIFGTWQNVEMTVYIKAPPAMASFGISHLQPKTEHYCLNATFTGDDNDLFGGYIVYVDYNDKAVYFKKEESHNIGYSPRVNQKPQSLVADQWYGFRMAAYTVGSYVKMECYVDETDGLNGGDWKLLTEWLDKGNELIDGVAYAPHTEVVREAAIRTDDQGTGSYFDYKWLTVREILPASQPPPPTGGGAGQIVDGVSMQFESIGSPIGFHFSSDTDGRSQWVADLPHCFVNIEVTGYLFIHGVENDGEEVSIKLRGGPHTDDNNDWGSCYIIGIGYDGSVNSQYEEPHPDNHDMAYDEVTSDPLDGDAIGKWFGIKAIVWEEGGEDHIECWIDPGGLDGSGKPKNEWVLFWEATSDQFTGECNGDGDNERAYFRMDDVSGDEEDAVDVKFASAREIDPNKRFT